MVFGRILAGICNEVVSVIVSTYIGEIASPNIRGFLGQLLIITNDCGTVKLFAANESGHNICLYGYLRDVASII